MGFGGFQGIGASADQQRLHITEAAIQAGSQENVDQQAATQATSRETFTEESERAGNPVAKRADSKKKTERPSKERISKMMNMAEKGQRMLPIERIKDSASQFQQRNPELKAPILTALRERIKPDDTAEEILKKVSDFYPDDPFLAREALDFLLETTDGELAIKVQQAKDELIKNYSREISIGENISEKARTAAPGLGQSPTTMRELYKDITGSPRDSNTLFTELSQRYQFKELRKVIQFLLHSLGSDMKSKGPSIPRPQLQTLLTETRNLQAILGVYRFFQGRMNLMEKLFHKEGLQMPQKLTFELMSKAFMGLCSERYPTAEKVKQQGSKLGLEGSSVRAA